MDLSSEVQKTSLEPHNIRADFVSRKKTLMLQSLAKKQVSEAKLLTKGVPRSPIDCSSKGAARILVPTGPPQAWARYGVSNKGKVT